MPENRSPMRMLAISEFKRQFGDLFGVKAEIFNFERSIIEGTYELMWLDRHEKSDSREWARTLRASFNFLDKGFLINPRKVARAFYGSINHIVPAANHSLSKKIKAEKTKVTDLDEMIENYLSFYKTMYESLVSVVMAPVVYSFAISRRIKNLSFSPQGDGRISLGAIGKMEKWLIYPQNRLAIGLNSHLRNAYSHDRFRILDGGEVEIWDRNPRTKKTWGPEVWTIEDLQDICGLLWQNTQAVICAIALFSINNRRTMEERGWAHLAPAPPLRINELKSTIGHYAHKYSFRSKEFNKVNRTLSLTLATKLKGIDQEQTILVGGTIPRQFKMPVRYVEVSVIKQALGFLQTVKPFLDGIEIVKISFIDPDKNHLGLISIKSSAIERIKGPKYSTIEIDRRLLSSDTIENKTMWRKDEYPVNEV